MTDTTKYKNVSLSHPTYDQLHFISKKIIPGVKLSISKTVESLAAKELQRINGKDRNINKK